MHPLHRLVRHWRTPLVTGPATFPPATLREIENVIEVGKTMHRAHLHVAIEVKLPASAILRRESCRQRARRLFDAHRLWDIENRSSLLIYLNLADRQVEIVADHGVCNALTTAQWRDICQQMSRGFAAGQFHAATLDGLKNLNHALQRELPHTRNNVD